MNVGAVADERHGLLAFLSHQRQAVRAACYGIDETQARTSPTASALTLGGLVKHLARGERDWIDRVQSPSTAPIADLASEFQNYMASFALEPGETLGQWLEEYERVAAETQSFVEGVDDLNQAVPLPPAPWFPEPGSCTIRWVLLHLIDETARHAGHADIIRECLDGATSGPLLAAMEDWPDDGFVTPWRPEQPDTEGG